MGVDFRYVGSKSYLSFERELIEISKFFGGTVVDKTKPTFLFPYGTDPIIIKWFNDIYSMDFTPEETSIIWKHFKKHPEIKNISETIWTELKALNRTKDAWYIY